mmetsp:Transcript_64602/g.189387  ORF Transcript_64602/g.189387 Transcript_64602/m.189387 type:complete len:226 (-) Transcript_64602:997-1674(-)
MKSVPPKLQTGPCDHRTWSSLRVSFCLGDRYACGCGRLAPPPLGPGRPPSGPQGHQRASRAARHGAGLQRLLLTVRRSQPAPLPRWAAPRRTSRGLLDLRGTGTGASGRGLGFDLSAGASGGGQGLGLSARLLCTLLLLEAGDLCCSELDVAPHGERHPGTPSRCLHQDVVLHAGCARVVRPSVQVVLLHLALLRYARCGRASTGAAPQGGVATPLTPEHVVRPT